MIQILVAIGIAIWFYRSARAAEKSAFGWAVLGALAMLAPSIPWGLFANAVVLPAILGSDIGRTGVVGAAILTGLVGVALGCAVAWWLHSRYLRAEKRI